LESRFQCPAPLVHHADERFMPPTSGVQALFSPWGRRTLDPEETTTLRLGTRSLWIRAEDGEIWIAHREAADVEADGAETPVRASPDPDPPEGVEWSRWATPKREREVILQPALPDRTVVLKPERSFKLMNRSQARVFVRVPLWIRVELVPTAGGDPELLAEIPSLVMSDTWWGDFMEGELAYWLPTTARREMRLDLHLPHLAVCPLELVNRSGTDLAVEKLAFRVPHLSLFVHQAHFWADQARVTYQDDVAGSQIELAGRTPEEAEGGALVGEPRTPALKGFRARTFDRFRHLPGVGGVG